jgi:hypothetical protein
MNCTTKIKFAADSAEKLFVRRFPEKKHLKAILQSKKKFQRRKRSRFKTPKNTPTANYFLMLAGELDNTVQNP